MPELRLTSTPVPSATASALPLVYSRLVPTPTAFGVAPAQPGGNCQVAQGWLPYQVVEGDTLLAIAEGAQSSIGELQKGNCFEAIRGALVGETLYLPVLPGLPPATKMPIFPDSSAPPEVIGCESAAARIDSPVALQEIRGIIQVVGSIILPEDARYWLEVRPAWSEQFIPYIEGDEDPSSDVIALINSEVFGIGLHRLRLRIVHEDGAQSRSAICDIPVIFLSA